MVYLKSQHWYNYINSQIWCILTLVFGIFLSFTDFVLVYEEDTEKQQGLQTQKGSLDHKRYKFLESLRKSGLEIEEVSTEQWQWSVYLFKRRNSLVLFVFRIFFTFYTLEMC